MINYLLFTQNKNRLRDKSVGLKNGLSAGGHFKNYQMKAANQLAHYKGCLKVI